MKYLASAALILASLNAYAKTETKEFDSRFVKSLEIENMQGDINITGITSGKMVVIADQTKFPDDCRLEMVQEGTEVKIKVDQKSFLRKDCVVQFTINVPQAIQLEIKQGSGNVTVVNTKGKINYKVGSGDVSIDSEISEIDGKIGSGSTTVKGLQGEAHFFAGSGDHHLVYTKAPTKGELNIKTGSGSADVTLPADSKIAVEYKTASGSVHNEIAETKKAKFKVQFKAGSGDLTIKKSE